MRKRKVERKSNLPIIKPSPIARGTTTLVYIKTEKKIQNIGSRQNIMKLIGSIKIIYV